MAEMFLKNFRSAEPGTRARYILTMDADFSIILSGNRYFVWAVSRHKSLIVRTY
ncbi:MAG: hypothetical protein OXD49_02380 [Candidatus Poribacteria bacterium]|nr:hypothetical protein [Candidatus Poribacteria bacterium]